MKSALRAWRIGRVVLHYRLDDLLDDTPAQRWLRLGKPFVPRAPAQVAALPRGARLRLALQELGPIFVKFGQILSTRRDLVPADIADELTLRDEVIDPTKPHVIFDPNATWKTKELTDFTCANCRCRFSRTANSSTSCPN